jgi:hypothetical protein
VKDAEAERVSHAECDLLARAAGCPISVTQKLTDAVEVEPSRIVAQLIVFVTRLQRCPPTARDDSLLGL